MFISSQGVKLAIRELREVIPEVKNIKILTFWKIEFFDPGTKKTRPGGPMRGLPKATVGF